MPTNHPRRFLVLHGWQNRRPPQHWQWQLVEALRQDGEQVLYPQFPDPDRPSLANWIDLAYAELAQLGSGERIVITHSLGASLWLHVATRLRVAERVDRVLLVSPPSPDFVKTNPEIAEFGDLNLDQVASRLGATETRIVCSDNDPCCPEGAATAYASFGVEIDIVPGAGHITPDTGYGCWPGVLAWCRDPDGPVAPK